MYEDRPTQLRLLNDGAGILRVNDRRQVEQWIKKFNKEFPTCYFTVHTVDLKDHENAQSYGIWALNEPSYSDLPTSSRDDSGLCLVIDVHKKQAAISYGYQLEPYLNDELCFNAIANAHPYMLDHSYIEALELMRHGIRKMMRSQARKANSILKKKRLTDRIK